ncbi:MAG: FHA domain-containing protein [Chloroflexi bacterium]|nr:FHA domain-containing protein [Chloroflexota bacterium]
MKFGVLRVTTADGRSREYPIDLPSLVLGRAGGCSVIIDDLSVARRHARLSIDSGRLMVEDLGSQTGTFIDGQRIPADTPSLVESSSDIRLGDVTVRYEAAPQALAEAPIVVAGPEEADREDSLEVPGEAGLPAEMAASIQVSLSPPPAPIGAGTAPGVAYLTVRNRGRVVDELNLVVNDLPPEWVRLSTSKLVLLPGDQAEVTIIVAPPRRSDARAGDYRFSVSVVSGESGREVLTEGQITVLPFEGTELALRPVRSKRNFTLAAVNRGNALATYSLSGVDDEEAFLYQFEAPAIDLQAGEERLLGFRVTPKDRSMFGQPETVGFRVLATSTTDPATRVTTDGQLYVVHPLQKWKKPFLLIGVLLIALAALGISWRYPNTPAGLLAFGKNNYTSVKNWVSGRKETNANDPEALYAGVVVCEKKGNQSQLVTAGLGDAPLFSQRDPAWATETYAKQDDTSFPGGYCGKDLAQCGSGITSVATIMALFEVLTMPDGQPLNPKTVNAWFNAQARKTGRGWVSQGYVYGDPVWSAVNQLSGEIAKAIPGTRTVRFAGLGSGSDDEVRSELKAGRFVILDLPGYYIAAVGLDGDKILINDPYYRDRKTLDFYKGKVTGSVLFEPSTDLSSVVVTVPSDMRLRVTDATGKVVGTLTTAAPAAAQLDAQTAINGSSYRFKRARRDPTCVESPPPTDAGTNQIALPGNIGQYKIEVIAAKGGKTSAAIHTYDQRGQVSLRADDADGPLVIGLGYDPTKPAPIVTISGGASDGGAPAVSASATTSTIGGDIAPGTGGAAGAATPTATRIATPLPGAGTPGAGTPAAGPATPTAPPTATPTPPRPPNNVTLVCTPTYATDPMSATVSCTAAVDGGGASNSLNWTVNGIQYAPAANKTTLAVSFAQDVPLPVQIGINACNAGACKSAAWSGKVQFPSTTPVPGTTPKPSGTATATPAPAVTNASVVCSVTYDPYAFKRGALHCDAEFFGQFTATHWEVGPGASPAVFDTGIQSYDGTVPLGLSDAPISVIVNVRICNLATCVNPGPVTTVVQYIPGVALAVVSTCLGQSGSFVALNSGETGYAQWFVNGIATGGQQFLDGGTACLDASGLSSGDAVTVLYGGSQVFKSTRTW